MCVCVCVQEEGASGVRWGVGGGIYRQGGRGRLMLCIDQWTRTQGCRQGMFATDSAANRDMMRACWRGSGRPEAMAPPAAAATAAAPGPGAACPAARKLPCCVPRPPPAAARRRSAGPAQLRTATLRAARGLARCWRLRWPGREGGEKAGHSAACLWRAVPSRAVAVPSRAVAAEEEAEPTAPTIPV